LYHIQDVPVGYIFKIFRDKATLLYSDMESLVVFPLVSKYRCKFTEPLFCMNGYVALNSFFASVGLELLLHGI